MTCSIAATFLQNDWSISRVRQKGCLGPVGAVQRRTFPTGIYDGRPADVAGTSARRCRTLLFHCKCLPPQPPRSAAGQAMPACGAHARPLYTEAPFTAAAPRESAYIYLKRVSFVTFLKSCLLVISLSAKVICMYTPLLSCLRVSSFAFFFFVVSELLIVTEF